MKTILAAIMSFLMFISTILFQNYSVKIEPIGYGITARDVIFIISNTGEFSVKDITILVDGEEYETISGTLGPKKAFQEKLHLNPGEHLIEAKTSEGAHDSINITISSIEEKPRVVEAKKTSSLLEKNKVFIGLLFLFIVSIVVTWFLSRKPRVKLYF